MQIGQVRTSPNPKLIKPTKNEMTIIMIPPQMVEYNMPNGPKKKVNSRETPILFTGTVTIV